MGTSRSSSELLEYSQIRTVSKSLILQDRKTRGSCSRSGLNAPFDGKINLRGLLTCKKTSPAKTWLEGERRDFTH